MKIGAIATDKNIKVMNNPEAKEDPELVFVQFTPPVISEQTNPDGQSLKATGFCSPFWHCNCSCVAIPLIE
jgi:hypothetical protein